MYKYVFFEKITPFFNHCFPFNNTKSSFYDKIPKATEVYRNSTLQFCKLQLCERIDPNLFSRRREG